MADPRRDKTLEKLRAIAASRGVAADALPSGELVDALRRLDLDDLEASEVTHNGEIVLDPDLENAEPARDATEHAERIERHRTQTEAPTHPESPPHRDMPGP